MFRNITACCVLVLTNDVRILQEPTKTSPLYLYIHPEDYSGAPMSHMQKDPKVFMVKHRHCSVCGLPVNVNKTFCSPECESQSKKMNRRRTYTLIAMTVIFPVFILLMYLVPLFR